MKKLWMCAVVAAVLVVATATSAQIGTSGIVGTVMDKSGAVVPGARVIATNEATNISHDTTTTSAGAYSFPGLIVGSYSIAVEAPGFKKWVGTQNVLTVGQPLVVNVQLEVGSLTSTVQVEGTYERLQTTNAMISDVIDRRAIANLPLNGRNPLNLIALQPGLVQRSNGNAGSGTHVNGSRDRAFNVTLDGIDINEPSVPNPQSNVYRIGTDNVQEYRVVTQDPTAEYGRNSGANISMATRSGTNAIHGDVFEYLRNTKLNANDWFTNASNVQKQAQGQPLVTKPGLKYNQFGADVGGPIFKNKTFFYASWVGQRLNFTESIAQAFGEIPQVLTPMARAGKLRYVVGTVNGLHFNDPSLVDSQGNLLPEIPTCSSTVTRDCVATYDVVANDPILMRLDPAMSAFINGGSFGPFNFKPTPLPNDKTVGDGLNTLGFRWNPPSSQPEERFLGRVDHQINENNSLFVRYLIAFADTKEGDFLNARPEVFPGFPPLGGVTRRPSNLAIGYRRVFSPQLVNQFTMGYARFKFGFLFGKANSDFPNIAPFNLFHDNSDLVDTPYNTNGSETAR